MSKLGKSYGHFAAAFGTLIVIQVCTRLFGLRIKPSGWWAVLVLVACAGYAAGMTFGPARLGSRIGFYGPFAAALGTTMLLMGLGGTLLVMAFGFTATGGGLKTGISPFAAMFGISVAYALLRIGLRSGDSASASLASRGHRTIRTGEWILLSVAWITLAAWAGLQHVHWLTDQSAASTIEDLEAAAAGELGRAMNRQVEAHFESEMKAAGRWESFVSQYPWYQHAASRELDEQRSILGGGRFGGAMEAIEFKVKSPDPTADHSNRPVLDRHRVRISVRVEVGPVGVFHPKQLRARILLRPGDLNDLLLPRLREWLAARNLATEIISVTESA